MPEPLFDRIALIGIGLIGSSIARDVKALGLAREVVVSTRSPETLKRAEELELGTSYALSAADAVQGADLIIVSVPVGASEAVARQIAPHLKPGAIVTDVGSTKASVIAQMAPHMPTNPENRKNYLVNNIEWWADNQDEVEAKFQAWLAK